MHLTSQSVWPNFPSIHIQTPPLKYLIDVLHIRGHQMTLWSSLSIPSFQLHRPKTFMSFLTSFSYSSYHFSIKKSSGSNFKIHPGSDPFPTSSANTLQTLSHIDYVWHGPLKWSPDSILAFLESILNTTAHRVILKYRFSSHCSNPAKIPFHTV